MNNPDDIKELLLMIKGLAKLNEMLLTRLERLEFVVQANEDVVNALVEAKCKEKENVKRWRNN